ncbi:MAG: copper-binding protein, partial [Shewanella sp.]|nr:copper-binding protein [Shewanella sp.]
MTKLLTSSLPTHTNFVFLRRLFCKKLFCKASFYSLALLLFSQAAYSASFTVNPADDLQHALNTAQDGDSVILENGTYYGNFIIPNAITLKAEHPQQAVIDAAGKGNALFVEKSHTTIEDLKIINWGQDLTEQNAGIYTKTSSEYLVIKNNYLQGDAFGIWLQKGKFIKVLNNTIIGNPELRSSDRGNAIQLALVQNVEVRNNDVSLVRDGLYIISSQDNVLENNTMHDLRYGIHYMYSHNNTVMHNTAYNTRAGYALMSS